MNKVYIVGAGPGDPGLITTKGLEILRQADVIIYDYLVDKRILSEARSGTELICCDLLGKKRYSDGFSVSQERINALLVKKAKQGKRVARLKNGDPSIFARTSQELDALIKNKIDFEIIPGVTAANSASAFSGIPLTDRRFASSCVFVTGHEDPAKKESSIDWGRIAGAGTIVLYMGAKNIDKIMRRLVKEGKDKNTPAAIIQGAGRLTQKIITGAIRDIAEKSKKNKIRPPAVIIIGDVARLEKKFGWLEREKRILYTGLSKERFFLPGAYFHLPLIKIEPLDNYGEFDNFLKDIKKFDWVVFSSRYGVEYFFKRLMAIGLDSRMLKDEEIAAIGASTASRLRDFGIIADLVPKEESSKGLLKEFSKINIKGKEVFLPRSDISDKKLNEGFEKLGARVSASYAYRNVPAKDLPALDLNWFHEIMFTSPSGVRNFKKRYGRLPRGVKAKCIGDVTLNEAKRCRL